ncbi:hypothetical protein BC835DRAFT_1423833 [Cytidiella melzeri]|nr:hypothetical protein BC835DRAFT_1423833 [Cytidiella melzeri]
MSLWPVAIDTLIKLRSEKWQAEQELQAIRRELDKVNKELQDYLTKINPELAEYKAQIKKLKKSVTYLEHKPDRTSGSQAEKLRDDLDKVEKKKQDYLTKINPELKEIKARIQKLRSNVPPKERQIARLSEEVRRAQSLLQ